MNEPEVAVKAFGWLLNLVFALAMFFGRYAFQRAGKRSDDIEMRLRELEKDAVTQEELRRLENKMDENNRQITDRLDEHNRLVTDRLDRILERASN